ncbi:MAG: NTP transferase domain-containing protein [Victivallaceae bacterium]|nr:NTP transferase domain-containing protein [Victivallaceae bacterium]
MADKSPEYTIILAAGKGSRMNSTSIPKVCFPIDGIPAVNRALKIYTDCGIKQHILVVGVMAGQVIETAGSEFPNTSFVYQKEQKGTANAVKTVFTSMPNISPDSVMLLTAGDRLIEQSVLERLFDLYYGRKCALAMLTLPARDGSSQGRVVTGDSGSPIAIVETADIKQRTIYKKLRAMAETGVLPGKRELQDMVITGFFGSRENLKGEKLRKAFGPLWELLAARGAAVSAKKILEIIPEEKTRFEFTAPDGSAVIKTPEEVEAVPDLNTSVYLVKKSLLESALGKLNHDNAQQEEYLSDIIAILAREAVKMRILRIDEPAKVQGFNNPAELLEIENNIRTAGKSRQTRLSLSSREFRPLRDWYDDINSIMNGKTPKNGLLDELAALYCENTGAIKRHLELYLPLLELAQAKIGKEKIAAIVRSPGRLNVMGRHVDHQGGNCNLMTIGFETLLAVHPRDDDMVCLYHVDEDNFASTGFSIGELVSDLPWDDWHSLVNSEKLAGLISSYGVDWSQYVKAAVLRLQKKFINQKLCGMDIVVSGNVPMAAGLSSSSSLVVGVADATVAVNKLDTFPAQLVTLCGEGEWFVGTRGGSADHAAVKLGERGKVVKVTFFDFAVEDIVDFPEGYVMAVCDSGIKARKSSNAKDQFNHRICCYRIGFMLIKKMFPQFAPLLKHLRDVNTRTLGLPLHWIYRILLHLPEYASLDELQTLLPDEDLRTLCANHKPPSDGLYPIRGVVLFGLSEFERSRLYADCLKKNDLATIGRLMNASHDGDRVSRHIAGKEIPFNADCSNSALLKLMEDLESGDPERVIGAQLQWQSGSYHCSIPAIDKMVDIALGTDGVSGAQLAGAGLGGCMMVLTRENTIGKLIENLRVHYYTPAKIKENVLICRPVSGAGLLSL